MEAGDSLLAKLQEDNDLFGAGSSDSEVEESQRPPSKNGGRENRILEAELDDEGSLPSPPMSQDQKKSRKSKSKHKASRKSNKALVDQLHSESQRVLRETPLNLPSYQPVERTLDSFLAKVRSRQALKASQSSNNKSLNGMTVSQVTRTSAGTKKSPTPPTLTPPPSQAPATPLDECSQSATSASTAVSQNGSSSTKYSRANLHKFLEADAPPPRLSTREEFSLDEEELPGAQLMRQRLQAQLTKSKPKPDPSQKKGLASLLPEETITKLKDTPGALRVEWKKAMQQQLNQYSQQRAEAQREQQMERKKLEEEEFGPDDEEMEEDMSDEELDSSDEEFVGEVSVREDAGRISDVCSDLDEEENVNDKKNLTSMGESEGDDNSEEEDDDDDNDDDDDDDDGDVRMTGKKGCRNRIVDSDDDGDGSVDALDEKISTKSRGEKAAAGSIIQDENSLTSLRLEVTDTMMGADSESSGFPPSSQTCYKPVLTSEEDSHSQLLVAYKERSDDNCELNGPGPGGDVRVKDSLGGKGDLKLQITGGKGAEELVKTKMSRLSSVESESDGESVGEMSFQWGQSLPPAQLPQLFAQQDAAATQGDSQGEESQWQATPLDNTQRMVEDETQILDEEGFIYVREKHSSPCLALLDALNATATTDGSPSDDIANLCSGQFPDTFPSSHITHHEPSTTTPTQDSISSSSSCSAKGDDSQIRSSQRPLTKLPGGSLESNSTQQSSASEESICLSQERHRAKISEKKWPESAEEVHDDGGSGGRGKESGFAVDEEDNAVWRWARRHQASAASDGDKGAQQSKEVPEEDVSIKGGLLDDDDGDDDDMPTIRRRKVLVHQTKAERLAEYVDSEAELSGEDVGPEEDEEQDEEDEEDMLNQYLLEEQELGISKEELWDQVAKAHMKHMASDDKFELNDFKERFLKDGDLFEDGLALKNGFFRSRHFAQGSEAGSLELFDRDSGDEEGGVAFMGVEETSTQDIAKMRRDRLEREEFIRKCRENESGVLEDENSRSILSLINDTTSMSNFNTPSVRPRSYKPCSSFLKRTKSTPSSSSQQSNLSSSVATPTNIGSVTNRAFVFQKTTPVVQKAADLPSAGKKRPSKTTQHSAPTSKRKPKLKSSVSTPSSKSIFKSLYKS